MAAKLRYWGKRQRTVDAAKLAATAATTLWLPSPKFRRTEARAEAPSVDLQVKVRSTGKKSWSEPNSEWNFGFNHLSSAK